MVRTCVTEEEACASPRTRISPILLGLEIVGRSAGTLAATGDGHRRFTWTKDRKDSRTTVESFREVARTYFKSETIALGVLGNLNGFNVDPIPIRNLAAKRYKKHKSSVIVADFFHFVPFVLFAAMNITVLGSGSTGNAVLIVAGNTLCPCHRRRIECKRVTRRLAMVGEDAQRLDAVLVTSRTRRSCRQVTRALGSIRLSRYISGQTLDAYVSERFNVSSDEPRRRVKRCAIASSRSSRAKTFVSARSIFILFHPARRRDNSVLLRRTRV